MLKKLEIVFFALCILTVVFLVLPAANKLSNCFSYSAGEFAALPLPPQVDKDTFCKNGQGTILALNSCLNDVKGKNPVAPAMLQLLALKNKNVQATIEKHNQVCPQYTVSSPLD